jgi:hypothetical protein
LKSQSLVTAILLGLLLFTLFPLNSLITSVSCSSFDSLDFSIIILPDTQYYSRDHPEIFTNQTQWVADNAVDLNVVFVLHLGDLVENGDSVSQWENATKSMSILEDSGVSWEVLPGNHEFAGDENLVNYNNYFGVGNFSGKSWFGGSYPSGTNNNNFCFFSGGENEFLIFNFQYQPSDAVLAWANTTVAQYPSSRVIVVTHEYLGLDGERTEEGNHIWNNFVAPHADQVFLVLCGHIHGEANRTDVVNGHQVHQLLSDYQDSENGGNGWLRILTFYPQEEEIRVKTFSPYLNSYETDANSQFTLSATNVIPEFPFLGFTLPIAIATIALIFYRKKLSPNPK